MERKKENSKFKSRFWYAAQADLSYFFKQISNDARRRGSKDFYARNLIFLCAGYRIKFVLWRLVGKE